MSNFGIKIEGLEKVVNSLDARGIEHDISQTIEAHTRQMAGESASRAPVRDAFLRNSLTADIRQLAPLTWSYGSNLPYATRQEYEHATHSGFIRNVVWDYEPILNAAIKKRLKALGE